MSLSVVNASDFETWRVSPYPARSSTSSRRTARNNLLKSATVESSATSSPASNTSTPNSIKSSVELLTNSNANVTSFLDLVSKVREGLKYHAPELCEEGVSGTYFLKDKNGKKIAVFKPQDEEGISENNPKRQQAELQLKSSNDERVSPISLPIKGILPGEAALREVAACLLDREHFYGVPRTQLVKIYHPNDDITITYSLQQPFCKIGSLQEFIDNDGCSEDYGFRLYPVNEVHKIGILDIQMLNVDRHSGNILVKKMKNNSLAVMNKSLDQSVLLLTPIDQGYSLPDNLECHWFEWMNWPQSKIPFDDDTKAYISRIDIDRDALMLKKELGIRTECIKTMKITTTLLKKAMDFNLTLYDIGLIICRKSSCSNDPSTLEKYCELAKARVKLEKKRIAMSNDVGSSRCSTLSMDFLDILSQIISDECRRTTANSGKSNQPAAARRI